MKYLNPKLMETLMGYLTNTKVGANYQVCQEGVNKTKDSKAG
jgi:hypothetical protein